MQTWTLLDESAPHLNKQKSGLQQGITRWATALPYCLKAFLTQQPDLQPDLGVSLCALTASTELYVADNP